MAEQTSNPDWIEGLRRERTELAREYQRINTRRNEVYQLLSGIDIVLKAYAPKPPDVAPTAPVVAEPIPVPSEPPASAPATTPELSEAIERFRRKKVGDIAKVIAEERDGEVTTAEVAKVLYQLGGYEDERAAYGTAYPSINRDPRFEKSRRGAFRLKGEQKDSAPEEIDV